MNYKYRMHDPRVGRFFAVDPLTSQYPHYTPYSFSGNKVIAWRELEGLEEFFAADGSYLGKTGLSNEIRIVTSERISIEIAKKGIKDYNAGKIDDERWQKNIERDTEIFDEHGNAKNGVLKHYFKKAGGDTKKIFGGGDTWPVTHSALMSTSAGKTAYNLPNNDKARIKVNDNMIGDGIYDEGGHEFLASGTRKEVILNGNDLTNCFVHEYDHAIRLLQKLSQNPQFDVSDESKYAYKLETMALNKQIRHTSWKGTSLKFKQHMWDTYGHTRITDKSEIKKYFGNFGVKISDE